MDTVGAPPEATIDGRYALRRTLSHSPRSRVFLARDLWSSGADVVIKTFEGPAVGDARELEPYADLAVLCHPNIIKIIDLGRVRHIDAGDGPGPGVPSELLPRIDDVFLVFPYLVGGDLATATAKFLSTNPTGEQLDRWLTCVSHQVLEALRSLHDLSRVHYDVKPEHILLEAQEPADGLPRVVLIDLGLSDRASTPLGTRVRGTRRFMAPEVLHSSLVDHRVDLYSLGATLHHCLASSHGQRETEPDVNFAPERWPDLSDLVPKLPTFWSQCIGRLLSREPEKRYPTAGLVLEEIRRRPAARDLPPVVDGRWPIEHCLGQEREFDYVARELEKLRLGEQNNAAVLLSGEIGVGRRAVARRLVDLARLLGVQVISTRVGDPADTPLAPLARILTQLRNCRETPSSLHRPLELAIRWLRTGERPPASELPPLRERTLEHRRFLGTLANLVGSLPPACSFLIVLEDLHRASPELIEALSLMSRQVGPARESSAVPSEVDPRPRSRVLFLATVDDTRVQPRTIGARDRTLGIAELARQPGVSRVGLRPLNPRRANDLLRDVLGPCDLPTRVLHALHESSGGMSRTFLSSLRECHAYGYLQRTHQGWTWSGPSDAPSALAAERLARAEALPDHARRVLALLACVGDSANETRLTPLAASILDRCDSGAGNGIADATETLEHLEREGWIDRDPIRDRVTLCRVLPDRALESIREEVLIAYANAVLAREADAPYAAARLLADTEHKDSVPDLLPRAVRTLKATFCDPSLVMFVELLIDRGVKIPPDVRLELALAEFEIGLNDRSCERLEEVLDDDPSPVVRVQALLTSGRLLRSRGEWSRARRRLDDAWIELRDGPTLEDSLRVEVTLELGEVDLSEGLLDNAIDAALRADELAANADPNDELLAARARVRLFLHEAYRRQGLSERAQKSVEEFLESHAESLQASWRARLLDRLALFAFRHGRYGVALAHWASTKKICEELGDTLSLANTLANLGRVYTNRGELDLATRHYQESLACLQQLDHRHGIAVSHNNMGQVYKIRNRHDEAERCFRTALEIWEDIGQEDKLQAIALNNLSELLADRGDYSRALEYSLRALEIRKALEAPEDIAFSYYRLAKIYQAQGELDRAEDFAEKCLEIRRSLGDKNSLAFSLLLLSQLHLLRGRYFECFRCLRQGQSNFAAIGNDLGRFALLMTFSRAYCEVGAHQDANDSINEASALARDPDPGEIPAALGAAQLAAGELSLAEASLRQAEDLLRAGGTRRDLTRVLLDKARLNLEIGHVERSEAALAEAYAHIEELGLRDLSPTYYRLRGTLLLEASKPDPKVAEKLLERGLEESRRLELAEETWRLLLLLARIARESANEPTARRYATEAVETLRELKGRVPAPFDARYLETNERTDALREWESFTADENGSDSSPTEGVVADAGATAGSSTPADRPNLAPNDARNDALTGDLLRLQEITLLLATERQPQTLLERILDAVLDLFQAERGFLILTEGAEHSIRAARNIDREEVERPQFKYSQSIAHEVAETGGVFLTNDAQNDERLADKQSVHDLRLQAIACFPLESLGRRLGVIYLENRFRKQLVSAEKIPLLEAFSSQAAVAIANAQLIAENEARRLELEESQRRVQELNSALEQRVEEQSRQLEVAQLEIRRQKDQLEDRFKFHNIIGACPQMQQLYRLLDRVAGTDLPILIEGESGTGKELVARALHYHADNRRRDHPFVSENCGAVAESLFESELFGHVRGSFTGADADRPGLFALAESGTLFLDEIHELSLSVQRKLLRVLQEDEYRPVGSSEFHTANVRLLSACNQPLAQLVQDGAFREDLYYRLNVIKIELPPLRDRGNDVILLAKHFLTNVVEAEGLGRKELSGAALRALLGYGFPGNVRELRNIIEKAAVLSPQPEIRPDDLFLTDAAINTSGHISTGEQLTDLPMREAKETFLVQYLQELLRRNDDVVARTARAAGVTRESLHRLLKKHGLR